MKTCVPQPADLLALAMSSALASRARISATPAAGAGSLENEAGSGSNAYGSFANFDPSASSWRTCRRFLDGALESYSVAWPRAGTTLSGTAFQLPASALRTDVTESSSSPGDETASEGREKGYLWPTPDAAGFNQTESPESFLARYERREGRPMGDNHRGTPLSMAVRMWPTPCVQDCDNHGSASQQKRNSPPLNAAVKMWPTPDAGVFNDGQSVEAWQARHEKERANGYNGNGGGTPLAMAVRMPPKMWGTPRANEAMTVAWTDENTSEDRAKGNLEEQVRATETKKARSQASLADATTPSSDASISDAQAAAPSEMPTSPTRQMWPTPEARLAKGHGRAKNAQGSGDLMDAVKRRWATPTAHDAGSARSYSASMADRHTRPHDLLGQVKTWPTPRAEYDSGRHQGKPDTLHSAVKLWPTPMVPNGGRSIAHAEMIGATAYHNGKKVQVDLAAVVRQTRQWPTPTSTDSADSARMTCERTTEWASAEGTTLTDAMRLSEAGLPAGTVAPQLSGAGALNAAWVEQLQGFPSGWTEFDLPATHGQRAQKSPSTTGKRGARSPTAPAEKAPSDDNA